MKKPPPEGLNPFEMLLFPFYDSRLRSESRFKLQKSIDLYNDLQNFVSERRPPYFSRTIASVWKRLAETNLRHATLVPTFWRQYLLNETLNVLQFLNASAITNIFTAFRSLNWFLRLRFWKFDHFSTKILLIFQNFVFSSFFCVTKFSFRNLNLFWAPPLQNEQFFRRNREFQNFVTGKANFDL